MILDELGGLYKVETVAEMLNVEEQTVRKWISIGKLKGLYLAGTTVRISETELENFVLSAMYRRGK